MNRKYVRIVASVLALALLLLIVILHSRTMQTPGDAFLKTAEIQREEKVFTSHGVMQKPEFERLMRTQGKSINGEATSANDIQYEIDIFNKNRGKSPYNSVRRLVALSALLSACNASLPLVAHEHVYQIGISVLQSDAGEASIGIMMLGDLRDKRAIPYLMPYLLNPNKDVRTCAKYSLRKLGVSS